MFTLLNPFALIVLAGLLVPVAIHLWNRRPGREVAVGSLRWLAAGANRRLRNLKLEQLWLLLLRAALLVVLAVAVAEPVWRQPQPASRGQVLLSPEVLGQPAFATLRPSIDSLRRQGYEVRWLATGFTRVPGAAWRADSTDSASHSRAALANPTQLAEFNWARVQQATVVFPSQPLVVVTPATLRNFQGPHPPLPAFVTWQMLPTSTTRTWLQSAALRADSLRLLLGRSNEMQTTFRMVTMARPQPGAVLRMTELPPFRFESDTAASQLKLLPTTGDSPTETEGTIPVHTQPLHVIIYSTASYDSDARYLKAGLRAAAVGIPMELILTTTAQPPNPAAPPDWLFWLSDAPLPTAWRATTVHGTNIWQEAPTPGVADTAIFATPETGMAAVSVLRRSSVTPAKTAQPLWTDGRGRAILTRQAQGQGAVYQLYTRLNPTWSELGDDSALPARLLALLQSTPADALPFPITVLDRALATHDQRAIDPTQLVGGNIMQQKARTSRRAPVPLSFRATDLRPWLVLAAGLLFLLERLLARWREVRVLSSTTASL